ncbi:MAG: hypothetical protein ACKO3P_23865, partial [Planctomycetaceae bacterium]
MNTSGWLLFGTLITGMMALDLWSGRRSSRAIEILQEIIQEILWEVNEIRYPTGNLVGNPIGNLT